MTDAGGRLLRHPGRRQRGRGGQVLRLDAGGAARRCSPRRTACWCATLRITATGNFEHGATVLEVVVPAGAARPGARAARGGGGARLAAARRASSRCATKRVKPGRDDKLLAGWNGLMIRGLAFASRVFERPEWARARRGRGGLRAREMWDGDAAAALVRGRGRRIDGFLEDYGDLAVGLTALYQATFEPRSTGGGGAAGDRAAELFWDAEQKAYLSAPRGQKDLVVATYSLYDNAFPVGGDLLTEAKVALAALTGRRAFLERAEAYLSRMRDTALANPFAYGHLWCAADSVADGAPDVTLVGVERARRPFLELLARTYAPTLSVAGIRAWCGPAGALRDCRGEDFHGGRPRRLPLPELHLHAPAALGRGAGGGASLLRPPRAVRRSRGFVRRGVRMSPGAHRWQRTVSFWRAYRALERKQ